MAALVLVAFAGLLVVVLAYGASSLRRAWVTAFLGVATFVLVTTELLSCVSAVARGPLILCWLMFIVLEGVALRRLGLAVVVRVVRERMRAAVLAIKTHKWPTAGVAVLLLVTLLIALVTPPNTWDSMTYHMARVAAWEQHRSVAFYPTSIPRQNYQMPLAEFGILHLAILSGGDGLAHLVQWCSFVACLLAVSLIASELGVSFRGSVFAALYGATIPMAILQSSSTQNDLVVTAFLLIFTYGLLRFWKIGTLAYSVYSGLALGAALVTKGTALLFSPAFGLLLGLLPCWKGGDGRPRVSHLFRLSIVPLVALCLTAGHLSRNYQLYRHPLSTEGAVYCNDKISFAVFFANSVRGIAMHLGVPWEHANDWMRETVAGLLGDELENPVSTWRGCRFTIPYRLHEDLAGNLPHLPLGALACMIVILFARRYGCGAALYAVASALSAVTFALVLKWQLWSSRLHTPLFFFAAPLVALVVYREGKQRRAVMAVAVAAGLCLYALPFLCLNETRPLISGRWPSVFKADRSTQVFRNAPWLERPFRAGTAAAARLMRERGLANVGLNTSVDDWEYPLRILLEEQLSGGHVRFHHVAVDDISARIPKPLPDIPIILSTRPGGVDFWASYGYSPVFRSRHLAVLYRDVPSSVAPVVAWECGVGPKNTSLQR